MIISESVLKVTSGMGKAMMRAHVTPKSLLVTASRGLTSNICPIFAA